MADDEIGQEDYAPGVEIAAEQANSRRKRAKAKQSEEADILQNLLATKEGRRFFYDILFNVCGMNMPQTSGDCREEYTLFREGARQVGLDLQTRALRAAKDQYIIMLSENLLAKE